MSKTSNLSKKEIEKFNSCALIFQDEKTDKQYILELLEEIICDGMSLGDFISNLQKIEQSYPLDTLTVSYNDGDMDVDFDRYLSVYRRRYLNDKESKILSNILKKIPKYVKKYTNS
jgi:hypothetical protein